MNKLSLTLLVSILCVLPAAAQSQRSSAQPSARHCAQCGRVETEANAFTPCLRDPDVFCSFVEDKKTKGSSQKTPANAALNTQVERAVSQATMKQTNSNGTSSAQTDAQSQRSSAQPSARHCALCGRVETEANAFTPCLRDPDVFCSFVEDEKTKGSSQKTPANAALNTQVEPLSPAELIDAEEELMGIRNQDINATFEKYPYLLDPAYRRASEATKQSLRRTYLQKDWARKVGI